jgi:NADH dehydrogenase
MAAPWKQHVIWAAGVKGVLIPGLEAAVEVPKANRYGVDRFNQINGRAGCVTRSAMWPSCRKASGSSGHPQVAPAAIQQAQLLVKNLIRKAEG